ncbi:hypothetical protein JDV02_006615 [Purpureocillium takamizusanense]|uniref:Uncharacterized protein n=1 Tax=Purpureocillium takamizusanense TaxID=2060973 RepID=A0A9Q8VD71_9HYPO|nr:uncharacterized protein JDV02_006615 [Purpureocillium takamizusanense]UNI20537.1 hypothetical protein JDV02_006615 [Purpureocillium takamizusanense]
MSQGNYLRMASTLLAGSILTDRDPCRYMATTQVPILTSNAQQYHLRHRGVANAPRRTAMSVPVMVTKALFGALLVRSRSRVNSRAIQCQRRGISSSAPSLLEHGVSRQSP